MSINFLVRLNRQKKPRIEVVRRITEEGKKPTLKSLGNLPSDLNTAYEMFVDKLDDDELMQLINKVANLQFNQEHFDASYDSDGIREIIDLYLPFYQALKELVQLARKHEIDFDPTKVMLTALLKKAHVVEQELSIKQEQPVNILESFGLKENQRYDKQGMKEHYHHGGQPLFKALTELKEPLGKVCDQFRLIAQQQYGKSARINVKVMQEYASKPSRYSLWYCGVAIDTLLHYGKNPLSILSPQKVIEHWARLRVKHMTVNELKKEFFKQFEVAKAAQAELSFIFDEVYCSLTSSTSAHQDEA